MTTSTVKPATFDLLIPQRATLRERIVLPFDGTERSAYAQVWKNLRRTELLFDLDVTVNDRTPEFDITIGAEWEQTRLMGKNAVWDLLVVNADGTRDHWLTGVALLSARVTEVTT